MVTSNETYVTVCDTQLPLQHRRNSRKSLVQETLTMFDAIMHDERCVEKAADQNVELQL